MRGFLSHGREQHIGMSGPLVPMPMIGELAIACEQRHSALQTHGYLVELASIFACDVNGETIPPIVLPKLRGQTDRVCYSLRGLQKNVPVSSRYRFPLMRWK